MFNRPLCFLAKSFLIGALLLGQTEVQAQVAPDVQMPQPVAVDGVEIPANAAVEDVLFFLSSRHEQATAEEYEDLGLDVQSVLYRLAEDTAVFQHYRNQAMSVLSNWPDEALKLFLVAQLDQALEADKEVNQAQYLACHHIIAILASTFEEAAIEVLEPLLYHQDRHVRMSTIDAIGRMGVEAGQSTLTAALAWEVDPVLRGRIEQMRLMVR